MLAEMEQSDKIRRVLVEVPVDGFSGEMPNQLPWDEINRAVIPAAREGFANGKLLREDIFKEWFRKGDAADEYILKAPKMRVKRDAYGSGTWMIWGPATDSKARKGANIITGLKYSMHMDKADASGLSRREGEQSVIWNWLFKINLKDFR